jgi:hypothetical protein
MKRSQKLQVGKCRPNGNSLKIYLRIMTGEEGTQDIEN